MSSFYAIVIVAPTTNLGGDRGRPRAAGACAPPGRGARAGER
jgi:hypothetical protein